MRNPSQLKTERESAGHLTSCQKWTHIVQGKSIKMPTTNLRLYGMKALSHRGGATCRIVNEIAGILKLWILKLWILKVNFMSGPLFVSAATSTGRETLETTAAWEARCVTYNMQCAQIIQSHPTCQKWCFDTIFIHVNALNAHVMRVGIGPLDRPPRQAHHGMPTHTADSSIHQCAFKANSSRPTLQADFA